MLKIAAFVSVAVMAVSVCLSSALFADPDMQEGMWEIKGDMNIEGMPFPMPPVPMAYMQCLTKKDMVPQKKEKDQDGKTIKNEIAGNTVTWVMHCKDKNGVTDSTGNITYKGNSFVGTVHTVLKDTEGSKSESTLEMSGKRTGDCK